MKKLFICVATVVAMASCSSRCEIIENNEDPVLRELLEWCCSDAYQTHLWLEEQDYCEYNDCCWHYVSDELRAKYESGQQLTVEQMEEVVAGLEKSPSFIDTLDEYDSFYQLYRYRNFGELPGFM